MDALNTPALVVAVDLASLLDLDDGQAWVGLTAGTDGISETHDVLHWSFATGQGSPFPVTSEDRAERLGTANAKVTLEGQVAGTSLTGLDLGASSVTIASILNEVGVELVTEASLPLTLEARPGSDADGATFETPGGARPKVRLDLSHRGKGVVSFRLVVEFAPSQKPAMCAGTPRTTEITTSFQVDPGLVSMPTTQPWQCLADDSQLRVPAP